MIEKHLKEDFLEEYQALKNDIRTILIQLEKFPSDQEAARALFRAVHSVKSNLHMVGAPELATLVHQLENLLDGVRRGDRVFSQLLSDLVFLNLEAVEGLLARLFDEEDVEVELLVYRKALGALDPAADHDGAVLQAIRVFDPAYEYEQEADVASSLTDDMQMFENLASVMEQRLVGKQDSTRRILSMSLAMNELAGHVVDSRQLRAAVLMHDVGMAFLPLGLLNKSGQYDEDEWQTVSGHPLVAAGLLENLAQWQEAREIVLQHHERVDGKGYPFQLPGERICAGAKLLAIADTFESMSHQRADREHRRTVIRIVAEVNACKGEQFDPYWVEIFNQHIRQTHLTR